MCLSWHRPPGRHARGLLAGALLAAGLATLGCEPPPTTSRYNVLAGKVLACHPDTGELTVRVSRRTVEGPAEESLYCVVTRDSEIYVNDKFSTLDEIQIGDAVELVGYRDPNPQLERFVVSLAYFDHPLPTPPRPPLLFSDAAATQAASEGHAEQKEP